jgi:hypothetical protein
VEGFAHSLIAKRRRRVELAYPLLFAIDGPTIRRYYARFYQLHPMTPQHGPGKDIDWFGAFLEGSLVGATHLPPYASDLAKYERLYFLARMASTPGGEQEPDGAQDPLAPSAGSETRPGLRPDVVVADFDYDVSAIEDALQAGAAIGEIEPGEACTILFRPGNGAAPLRMLRINPPTRVILDLCDGRRSIERIAAEAEAKLGGDLRDRVIEAIARLLAAEVLGAGENLLNYRPTAPNVFAHATQTESMYGT